MNDTKIVALDAGFKITSVMRKIFMGGKITIIFACMNLKKLALKKEKLPYFLRNFYSR